MTTPVAKVQVSIAGGAWQSGLVTAAFGQTVDFRQDPSTSGGMQSAEWDLVDLQVALGTPSGWTSVGGVPKSFAASPPTVTLPANSQTGWGKLLPRLSLNGNPPALNPDGSPNADYVASLTDMSTIVVVGSPNLGLHGVAAQESTQEGDTLRQWIASLMHDLRLIDALAGTVVAGTTPQRVSTATQIGGDQNGLVWLVDSHLGGFTLNLPDLTSTVAAPDGFAAALIDARRTWNTNQVTLTTQSGTVPIVDPNLIGQLGTITATSVTLKTRAGGWTFLFDKTQGLYLVK